MRSVTVDKDDEAELDGWIQPGIEIGGLEPSQGGATLDLVRKRMKELGIEPLREYQPT